MIHDHRPHEAAVIGNGGHGHGHLQRRDRDALPHGNLGEGNLVPILDVVEDAADLARQLNPGALTESKIPDVLVESRRPQFHADLGGADV